MAYPVPTPNFDPAQDPSDPSMLALQDPASRIIFDAGYARPADLTGVQVTTTPGGASGQVIPQQAVPPPSAPDQPPAPAAAPPPIVPPPVVPGAPAPAVAAQTPHLVTDTKTTTSTTSGVRQTPDLKAAMLGSKAAVQEGKDARAASVEAEQQRLEGGQPLVHETAEQATKRRELEERQQREMEGLQARHDLAESSAKQQVQESQKAIKDFQFHDFWDGKSGARRVGSALSVALGAYGAGLTKTANFALQILEKEMDDDHRNQVAKLGKLKDEEVMARTGLADARQARQQALAGLSLKYAGGLRLISAQLEEAAAKSNDQNFAKGVAAQVAKLREDAAAKDAAAQNELYQQAFNAAPKTSSTTVTSKKVADGPGAGGAGASLAAADAVAKLQSDIGSLDRVLGTIQQKPGAWDEFRNNSEHWKRMEALSKTKGFDVIRGLSQGVGAANISEEQGLKSPEAKKVYQGMQEALTSIAKGYGGVITEGDRSAAAAGLAVLNQNPQEAMRTLMQIRANLTQRLQSYGTIRGIGAQAAPPAPGAAPAGTTRTIGNKTYRFDGRGWLEAA